MHLLLHLCCCHTGFPPNESSRVDGSRVGRKHFVCVAADVLWCWVMTGTPPSLLKWHSGSQCCSKWNVSISSAVANICSSKRCTTEKQPLGTTLVKECNWSHPKNVSNTTKHSDQHMNSICFFCFFFLAFVSVLRELCWINIGCYTGWWP